MQVNVGNDVKYHCVTQHKLSGLLNFLYTQYRAKTYISIRYMFLTFWFGPLCESACGGSRTQ